GRLHLGGCTADEHQERDEHGTTHGSRVYSGARVRREREVRLRASAAVPDTTASPLRACAAPRARGTPPVMSDARSMPPRLPEPKLLIDGESVAPIDGGTIPVTNPATAEPFFQPPPP